MTRRDLLKLALSTYGGAACVPGLGPASAVDSMPAGASSRALSSLREIAASRGILFGSMVLKKTLATDPKYAGLATQQCGIVVPGNELKWDALHPAPGQFDFSEGDWIEQFASSHGMLLRGVPLVWEQALPNWFVGTVNLDNARQILLGHISTVAGHYAGQMHSWDVVNEAIWVEDGRADGLKVTPWLIYLGPEYIELAFHAAHQADPKAMLVYNQDRIEAEDSWTEKRRQAVLSLLTRLVQRGVPIHGLGIQSHIVAETNVTGPGFKRFLHAIEDLGLSILVTEMDVRDSSLPGDKAVRDGLVAKQYHNYLSFLLQFKSVKTVLIWGLSDRTTWLAKESPRRDSMPVRPLLYDAELQPKPAFGAVWRAFNEAPKRV
ncbi:MAG: endo-1,4-beta-xylanase [Terriglobia bacterium]